MSSPSEAVVDGQVVGRQDAPTSMPEQQPTAPPQITQAQMDDLQQQQDLVVLEQKARAVSLFVKIPLLAYISLNSDLPGLVRLSAALVGALEIRQLYQAQGAIQAMLPDSLQVG
jgi:hypothetical protein